MTFKSRFKSFAEITGCFTMEKICKKDLPSTEPCGTPDSIVEESADDSLKICQAQNLVGHQSL